MVISLTPNIGLQKPDNAELAKSWTQLIEIADDNNLLISAETNKPLTAYSPVLTATTTPPTVGAGNVQGWYQDWMGFVSGTFVLRFLDPGITAGNGIYGVSLPFPVNGVSHTVGNALADAVGALPGTLSVLGEGHIMQAGSINNSGSFAIDAVTIAGVSYARILTESHPGKTSRLFRNAMPFTFTNNDRITGSFFYKKA